MPHGKKRRSHKGAAGEASPARSVDGSTADSVDLANDCGGPEPVSAAPCGLAAADTPIPEVSSYEEDAPSELSPKHADLLEDNIASLPTDPSVVSPIGGRSRLWEQTADIALKASVRETELACSPAAATGISISERTSDNMERLLNEIDSIFDSFDSERSSLKIGITNAEAKLDMAEARLKGRSPLRAVNVQAKKRSPGSLPFPELMELDGDAIPPSAAGTESFLAAKDVRQQGVVSLSEGAASSDHKQLLIAKSSGHDLVMIVLRGISGAVRLVRRLVILLLVCDSCLYMVNTRIRRPDGCSVRSCLSDSLAATRARGDAKEPLLSNVDRFFFALLYTSHYTFTRLEVAHSLLPSGWRTRHIAEELKLAAASAEICLCNAASPSSISETDDAESNDKEYEKEEFCNRTISNLDATATRSIYNFHCVHGAITSVVLSDVYFAKDAAHGVLLLSKELKSVYSAEIQIGRFDGKAISIGVERTLDSSICCSIPVSTASFICLSEIDSPFSLAFHPEVLEGFLPKLTCEEGEQLYREARYTHISELDGIENEFHKYDLTISCDWPAINIETLDPIYRRVGDDFFQEVRTDLTCLGNQTAFLALDPSYVSKHRSIGPAAIREESEARNDSPLVVSNTPDFPEAIEVISDHGYPIEIDADIEVEVVLGELHDGHPGPPSSAQSDSPRTEVILQPAVHGLDVSAVTEGAYFSFLRRLISALAVAVFTTVLVISFVLSRGQGIELPPSSTDAGVHAQEGPASSIRAEHAHSSAQSSATDLETTRESSKSTRRILSPDEASSLEGLDAMINVPEHDLSPLSHPAADCRSGTADGCGTSVSPASTSENSACEASSSDTTSSTRPTETDQADYVKSGAIASLSRPPTRTPPRVAVRSPTRSPASAPSKKTQLTWDDIVGDDELSKPTHSVVAVTSAPPSNARTATYEVSRRAGGAITISRNSSSDTSLKLTESLDNMQNSLKNAFSTLNSGWEALTAKSASPSKLVAISRNAVAPIKRSVPMDSEVGITGKYNVFWQAESQRPPDKPKDIAPLDPKEQEILWKAENDALCHLAKEVLIEELPENVRVEAREQMLAHAAAINDRIIPQRVISKEEPAPAASNPWTSLDAGGAGSVDDKKQNEAVAAELNEKEVDGHKSSAAPVHALFKLLSKASANQISPNISNDSSQSVARHNSEDTHKEMSTSAQPTVASYRKSVSSFLNDLDSGGADLRGAKRLSKDVNDKSVPISKSKPDSELSPEEEAALAKAIKAAQEHAARELRLEKLPVHLREKARAEMEQELLAGECPAAQTKGIAAAANAKAAFSKLTSRLMEKK